MDLNVGDILLMKNRKTTPENMITILKRRKDGTYEIEWGTGNKSYYGLQTIADNFIPYAGKDLNPNTSFKRHKIYKQIQDRT